MMTTTPPAVAEGLARVEARRATVSARLEAAKTELVMLRGEIATAHEAYRVALTEAELAGASPPSREALNALRAREPEAEDRVAALEGALAALEGEWRRAQADLLDEQAAAMQAETLQRQRRLTELGEEILVRQREASEHGTWIANTGPVKTMQLQAEARRLRSTP